MEQGTAAKADFLANISHELRTPVTVAKGIAYVLRNRHIPDEEWDEFIQQLQASLDKLMMMVDEIITIAELERGTLELDRGDRPRAARATRRRRGRPAIPRHRDPAPVPRLAVRLRRPGQDRRGRARDPRQRLPLLPRRPTRRAARPRLDEGVVVTVTDRGQGMQRNVATQAFDQPFSTGEATPAQGEGRRGRRAPPRAPAHRGARRDPVDRPAPERRHGSRSASRPARVSGSSPLRRKAPALHRPSDIRRAHLGQASPALA